MNRLKFKSLLLLCLILSSLFIFATNAYATDMPTDNFGEKSGEAVECIGGEVQISSRVYELLFGKREQSEKPKYLIPGGDVFGIRIKEANVTVAAAPEGCALRRGDKILSINGRDISDASDVEEIMSQSRGGALEIKVIRGGAKISLTVMPKLDAGVYRLGVTLRKNAAGIGTVTFIDPETNVFGGLGHGVCDAESGALIDIREGEVTGVILGGINRGEAGKPGELSGVLNKRHLGSIDINDECGVFGVLSDTDYESRAPIAVGEKSDVKLGEAEIISTVKYGKKAVYKIEITEIDLSSTGSKSFKIKVTDPTLIALTGGIVRGMSGSPIIQNGKLVGAVTHVMVANPTEGYGIFIENMLNAAQDQVIPKVA
ncbi:MAG: SpoIVB peptidase [Clostridia bacterium]|nr:SpoIVB peptidase [Clostridia bacterium]